MNNEKGLDKGYELVETMHKVFKHPVAISPTSLPAERARIRASFMQEELDEFLAAETLEDQYDALIDLMYFAFGTFVEMGVRPDRGFEIVNEANMAKLFPDGQPRFREGDGKILKPEGWEAPEPKLRAEIERQKKEAAHK
ncbi:HAD family hydrolase [Microbacteriaceae bacterium 4G12]